MVSRGSRRRRCSRTGWRRSRGWGCPSGTAWRARRAPDVRFSRPRAALHLSLLAGTLVVEGITLASGNAASPYPLLYFLVATAAFCFLRPLEGALQAALILAAYSVGLVLAPPSVGSAPLRGVLFA